MKALLISVHAKWCALMMNGDKTIEVRKGTALYKAIQKLIDEYGYADIYVYCTKGNEDIIRESSPYSSVPNYVCVKFDKKLSKELPEYEYSSRGKVIFKFRCYKVEEIPHIVYQSDEYSTKSLVHNELLSKSQLSEVELFRYLNWNNGTAIHISVLEVFDRPKELSEFYKNGYSKAVDELYWYYAADYINGHEDYDKGDLDEQCRNELKHEYILTKAPQSWCYTEVE